MRIHTDNTEGFIRSLVASLSKDPSSLEKWRCIHIEHTDDAPSGWYMSNLQAFKQLHKDEDCDVVLCPDNDTLIISREHDTPMLHQFAAEFKAMGAGEWQWGETSVYELFYDWRRVRALLSFKVGNEQNVPCVGGIPQYNFGEIASLSDVFSEAKKRRRARKPTHVMIVEDDPLTRRLVSGTFKEHYALITAADAQEAIANYLLHAPDIVFLDIGLPDTSGFNVLRQILACDPDAYVVMFSANSYLDNVTAALSQGASGFIAKPFKKEKMHRYIEDSALHHTKGNA